MYTHTHTHNVLGFVCDRVCLSLSLSPCQMEEGKMMERRKKIALELSYLVIYCRPVPFDEDSKDYSLSPHTFIS